MTSMDVVSLSRMQFGLTALYHFLFIPLTLGLAVLLGIMESVYVMTGRAVWQQMTKFWGLLFGINFAMGIATSVEQSDDSTKEYGPLYWVQNGIAPVPTVMKPLAILRNCLEITFPV